MTTDKPSPAQPSSSSEALRGPAQRMTQADGESKPQDRVGDLDTVAPDAVSSEQRTDSSGPVLGSLTRDTGAGAAGGHDAGGPGGREPERRPSEEDAQGAGATDEAGV